MADKKKKPKAAADKTYKANVIGETFEAGKPTEADAWTKKAADRQEILKYIKYSERYWYLDYEEWFGSEKRKNKA